MAYEWERDEWWREVRSMTEAQRQAACGHLRRTGRVCPDCGDRIEDEL